ncbi:MAG: hypothetical protein U9R75_02415 [Candidatus Thermoplasmatota archaeon]|nr:hypothetical protein [Candidatus Thermoplasmatota archaeon]
METLWLIPLRIIPVVSHEKLAKGSLGTPTSGLDRFNLTDVGDAFYRTWTRGRAKIILKGVQEPFPWEMVFKVDGDPKASLRGMLVGSSTFRSIFKLTYSPEDGVKLLVKGSLDLLDRDLANSKYWDDTTWEQFRNLTGLSMEQVHRNNAERMSDM